LVKGSEKSRRAYGRGVTLKTKKRCGKVGPSRCSGAVPDDRWVLAGGGGAHKGPDQRDGRGGEKKSGKKDAQGGAG